MTTTEVKISMTIGATALVALVALLLAGAPLTGWGIISLICGAVSVASGALSLHSSKRHTPPGCPVCGSLPVRIHYPDGRSVTRPACGHRDG